MKKVLLMSFLVSILMIGTALATPMGLLFTDVKEPVTASSLSTYSKTATGTNMSILGLIGIGDSSIEKIAKAQGINKIQHVDKHVFSIPLFLYISETFTIYGD